MDTLAIAFRIIVSFLIGAAIGLEREINEKKTTETGKKPQAVLGLRSFSLITSLGTITGFLFISHPALSLLIGAGILLMFIVFYVIDSMMTKDSGITTEFAMVYSYVIGILLALDFFPVQVTLALAVVLILILSRKRNIKQVVEDIRQKELNAFIAFAIIAVVILPFLPNTTYAFSDFPGVVQFFESIGITLGKLEKIELFNPFRLWFIVVLITGIDMIGYVLERAFGQKKGWIMASIAGGFVSSTATTQTLAQQSNESRGIHHLLAAALLANSVSFLQIAILLSPINPAFVVRLLPTFLMLFFSALSVTYYFLKTKEQITMKHALSGKAVREESIFQLGAAIRFSVIFILISIVSKVALEYAGSGAFLLATAVGALAGLDAVMINTAQLAGGRIDISLAVIAFIIANAVNLLGKSFYSYLQGKREFAVKFFLSILIIIASSLIGLLFM
jgi:uncharacterized membrane protein (DUF4010 family)